jgi:hypothetical protein
VKPFDSFVGGLLALAIIGALLWRACVPTWDKAEADPERDSWAKRALTRLRSAARDVVRAWTAQRPPRRPALPELGGGAKVVRPDPTWWRRP